MINLKCQSEGPPGISRHGKMLVSIWLGLALLPAMLTGCSQKLLRENVLATTQSMFGISLAQNPQTQIYELKIGFARNEFFLVPTSKRIVYDENDKDAAGSGTTPVKAEGDHYDPSLTPEVLAEIQVGGSGKQSGDGQGATIEVYQRLAVGKLAVQSGAAIALMANDKATASAIAGMKPKASARGSELQLSAVNVMYTQLKGAQDDSGKKIKVELDKLAANLPGNYDYKEFAVVGVLPAGVDHAYSVIQKTAVRQLDFQDVISYLSKLNGSRDDLYALLSNYKIVPALTIHLGGNPVTDAIAFPLAMELRDMEKLYEKRARSFLQNSAVDDGINYLFGK